MGFDEMTGVERQHWLDQLQAGHVVYMDAIARNTMGDVFGGELHTILWADERTIGLTALADGAEPLLVSRGTGVWYGGHQMIRPATKARKEEAAVSKAKRIIDSLRMGGADSLDAEGCIKVAATYAAELERVSAERERMYAILKMNTGVELKRSPMSGWDALTADGIKLIRQIPTKHRAYLAAIEECNKLARRGVQEAK